MLELLEQQQLWAMISRVGFICTSIPSILWNHKSAPKWTTDVSQSGCPRNFPDSHRQPRLNETCIFEVRESDTQELDAIACVGARGVFLGWIRRCHRKAMDRRLMNEELIGRFTRTKAFEWKDGGGSCVKMTIQLLHVRPRSTHGRKEEEEASVRKNAFVEGWQKVSRKSGMMYSSGFFKRWRGVVTTCKIRECLWAFN